MRVAALCDVHGNLPALEAVLAEVATLEVDHVVCGGDVAAGPFPQECLQLLLDRDAIFARGNGDREPGDWAEARLGRGLLAFLRALPTSVAVGGARYCHGSPRSDEEILTRVSSDERIRAALEGVTEATVIGGHTHIQFERDLGDLRFVNAGSVGRPYEGRPGAFWTLLDGVRVEPRRTAYAVDAAVASIRSSGYPDPAFVENLLEPPDPAEVSAYFESLAA
ncbi:MAG: metallophosphoesterase family protein [Gaiellaceae bacterium]